MVGFEREGEGVDEGWSGGIACLWLRIVVVGLGSWEGEVRVRTGLRGRMVEMGVW